MNNIVIEGRLAQDPEQKQSQNGKMMTTRSMWTISTASHLGRQPIM